MSRILVIEDDALIQKAVEMRFKKEGFDVTCCNDGRTGIEKLVAELPDLVITDLMLPYMSGLEIVTAAKAITEKDIKIVVVSSMGQEHIVEEAFTLGVDDYITKPFSLTELTLRIKKQLKNY
jgi:two-component system response regulator VicR